MAVGCPHATPVYIITVTQTGDLADLASGEADGEDIHKH
ncbi:hypothetical protein MY8738_008356, partial [Beauveria namnaoensis]